MEREVKVNVGIKIMIAAKKEFVEPEFSGIILPPEAPFDATVQIFMDFPGREPELVLEFAGKHMWIQHFLSAIMTAEEQEEIQNEPIETQENEGTEKTGQQTSGGFPLFDTPTEEKPEPQEEILKYKPGESVPYINNEPLPWAEEFHTSCEGCRHSYKYPCSNICATCYNFALINGERIKWEAGNDTET